MNVNTGDEDGFVAAVSQRLQTLGFAFAMRNVKVPDEDTIAIELNLFKVPKASSRTTANTALDWVMELEDRFGILNTFVHVHCDDLDPAVEASIMETSDVTWQPGKATGQPLTT